MDTTAYPAKASSCVLTNSVYTKCVTDAQLQAELTKLKTSKALPLDLAHIYPIFLPPAVETYDSDGTNSDSSFCGYHGNFPSGTSSAIYGNEPYSDGSGCGGGEDPNGLLSGDTAVDVLSHEISEAMTDPTSNRAWNDKVGYEIGDVCAGYYGPPLGFTTTGAPTDDGASGYNVVINGHDYYTQTEFSDAAYTKLGVGNGCVTGEASVTAGKAARAAAQAKTASANGTDAPQVLGSLNNDAFPNTLPADGSSTSDLDVSASTPEGYVIAGDKISYSTYVITGDGSCGTISAKTALTDDSGHAHVTYTASKSNVVCAVVANDQLGGQNSTGMIYQGTFQDEAIQATNTYPASLASGGPVTSFSIGFKNPSLSDDRDSRINFVLFPGDGATQNIDASQVTLSYSTTGPNGAFTPVSLEGSTINDGAIQGIVLPLAGVTIAAGATLTVTFHIQLAAGINTANGAAGIAIESYLDQVNPASGAIATYGDTLAYEVAVTPPTPTLDARNTGFGTSKATAGLTTKSSGDLIFAAVSAGGPSTCAQTVKVTGGQLSWTLLRRTNGQTGTAEVWVARSKGVLKDAVITATASRSGYGVFLYVGGVKQATTAGKGNGASHSGGAPSVSTTTTHDDSYVIAVGNDPSSATPRTVGPHQTLIAQKATGGNTYWVQASNTVALNAGSVVTINDTAPTHDRWNLTVVTIQ